jgi:hypothetical protein
MKSAKTAASSLVPLCNVTFRLAITYNLSEPLTFLLFNSYHTRVFELSLIASKLDLCLLLYVIRLVGWLVISPSR